MGYLAQAVDISELGQRNLWVPWGKSGTGKTKFVASLPKSLLYIRVGDDGSNTIANVDGIKAIHAETLEQLKEIGKELQKDKKFASVAVDTFSMITNVWIDQNITQKKKKMTQQAWGDLKVETEELIRIRDAFRKKAEEIIPLSPQLKAKKDKTTVTNNDFKF